MNQEQSGVPALRVGLSADGEHPRSVQLFRLSVFSDRGASVKSITSTLM